MEQELEQIQVCEGREQLGGTNRLPRKLPPTKGPPKDERREDVIMEVNEGQELREIS